MPNFTVWIPSNMKTAWPISDLLCFLLNQSGAVCVFEDADWFESEFDFSYWNHCVFKHFLIFQIFKFFYRFNIYILKFTFWFYDSDILLLNYYQISNFQMPDLMDRRATSASIPTNSKSSVKPLPIPKLSEGGTPIESALKSKRFSLVHMPSKQERRVTIRPYESFRWVKLLNELQIVCWKWRGA